MAYVLTDGIWLHSLNAHLWGSILQKAELFLLLFKMSGFGPPKGFSALHTALYLGWFLFFYEMFSLIKVRKTFWHRWVLFEVSNQNMGTAKLS